MSEGGEDPTLQLRNYPTWVKWLAALVTVCAGVVTSMSFKWQNRQYAAGCDGCAPVLFVGALFQSHLMFMGEMVCYIIWAIDRRVSKPKGKSNLFDFEISQESLKRKELHFYIWCIPSLLDFTATTLCNLAMLWTYAATVQMLRNFMVVVSALCQLVMLRRALKVHEWIGVIVITGAMVLVAIPSIRTPDADADTSATKTAWGIICAILGTSVQAFMLLLEEYFLTKGRGSPMKCVGIEGMSGIVYCFIAWPIFQRTGLEDVTMSWYQMTRSGYLSMISIIYIPFVIAFNAAGLATTKLGGGLLRSVCFALRAPLVWLFSLAFQWQGYDNWNLGSMFMFIAGFTVYADLFPSSWSSVQRFLRYPVPCFCTKPELDDMYETPIKRRGDESELLATREPSVETQVV